jgi:hypothetical protein
MEGHLGRTRDKVEGVGQQLAATNFGTQTMGVLGTGMTGTLNNTLGTAHEQVTRASTAVEHAGAQTTAVRQGYEQTDANAVEALKNTSKSVAAPPAKKVSTDPAGTTTPSSSGGGSGGTPPPHNPPPGGGGAGGTPARPTPANSSGEHWMATVQKNFSPKDFADFQRAMHKMSADPKPAEVPGSGQLTRREKDLAAHAMRLIQLEDGTLMQKVIPPDSVKGYLGDLRSDGTYEGGPYTDVRGFVARHQDAGVHTTPHDVIQGNRLDYPNTPYHDKMGHIHAMEFPATEASNYQKPVGAPSVPGEIGGKNPAVQRHSDEMMDSAERAGNARESYARTVSPWPYSGIGVTAHETGVPEFKIQRPLDIPNGAKINEYDASGNKRTLAVYRDGSGWVQP